MAQDDRNIEYKGSDSIEYAGERMIRELMELRERYAKGELTDEMIYTLSDGNDSLAKSTISFLKASRYDLETSLLFKSDLSEGSKNGVDTICPVLPKKEGETIEIAGCKITCTKDAYRRKIPNTANIFNWGGDKTALTYGEYKVESDYLGDFEFDGAYFTIGYKQITEADGTVNQIPVLKCDPALEDKDSTTDIYFGGKNIRQIANTGSSIKIPDGVKCLDYTFENLKELQHCPSIPSSVESAHCAFVGCSNMYDLDLWTELPENLQDMSYMFKGCTNLLSWFRTDGDNYFPANAVNIIECFNGCENMDMSGLSTSDLGQIISLYFTEKYSGDTPWMKYDSEHNQYLSDEFVRDVYAGISNNGSLWVEKLYGADFDELTKLDDVAINNGRKTEPKITSGTSKKDVDSSILEIAQTGSLLAHAGEISATHVITNQELANKHKTDRKRQGVDANGNAIFYDDVTGLKASENAVPDNAWWERVAIDGVVGAGLFGAVAGITDNKLAGLAAGVGGTYLLDKLALPKTLYPILDFTQNLLPEGKIKDKFIEWRDKLPAAKVLNYNKQVRANNQKWDDQYNVGNEWKGERLAAIFEMADGRMDIRENMRVNAELCSKEMTFIAIAVNGENSIVDHEHEGECKEEHTVRDVLNKACDDMESAWIQMGKEGKSQEFIRNEMRKYYTHVFEGISAYSEGGLQGAVDNYGLGTNLYNLSKAGLGMTNRTCVDELMQNMMALNDKYKFMDDATWDKICSLNVEGVDMKNLKQYTSTYFDTAKEQAALACAEDVSKFKTNRGMEDAEMSDQSTDKPTLSDVFSNATSNTDTTKPVDQSEPKSTSGNTREIPYEEADSTDLSEPVKV